MPKPPALAQKRIAVKTARILLLLLLAALLPSRAALGEAVRCAGDTDGRLQVHAVARSHSHVAVHMGDGEKHQSVHFGASHPSTEDCNDCTASCSAVPFLSEPRPSGLLTVLSALEYPAAAALPASHLTGGPERPPRSI